MDKISEGTEEHVIIKVFAIDCKMQCHWFYVHDTRRRYVESVTVMFYKIDEK